MAQNVGSHTTQAQDSQEERGRRTDMPDMLTHTTQHARVHAIDLTARVLASSLFQAITPELARPSS